MSDNTDKLMSHEYDGIQEFDNNLPPWWLYMFYFTIVIGIGYIFYYHVFDYGESSAMEYRTEELAAFKKYKSAEYEAMKSGVPLEKEEQSYALLKDESDLAKGKKIFTGNRNACFTCHGNEAQGLVGPNLTDSYWVAGGDFQSIVMSIKNGNIQKGMQPFGLGNSVRLNNKEVQQVVSYIISLKGSNPPNPKPVDMARAKLFEGEYK